jgi:4-amino-4-deoxychorismate lyase
MCQFIETIKVENKVVLNLDYHQERMSRTMAHFFPDADVPVLGEIIKILGWTDESLLKCRIIYGAKIEKIELEKYTPRAISRLKVVLDDEIDYSFKFADRSRIQHLLNKKGNCDDVLIVKNGLFTDTSYCNILFFDGNRWITPELPLLHGTCSQRLLDSGKITARRIKLSDLHSFSKFVLINAMLDFDESRALDIGLIEIPK